MHVCCSVWLLCVFMASKLYASLWQKQLYLLSSQLISQCFFICSSHQIFALNIIPPENEEYRLLCYKGHTPGRMHQQKGVNRLLFKAVKWQRAFLSRPEVMILRYCWHMVSLIFEFDWKYIRRTYLLHMVDPDFQFIWNDFISLQTEISINKGLYLLIILYFCCSIL